MGRSIEASELTCGCEVKRLRNIILARRLTRNVFFNWNT